MEYILTAFTQIFESFLYGASTVLEWFVKPWFTWGDTSISPIMIFSLAGLMIVLGVMLIKFLNPAS